MKTKKSLLTLGELIIILLTFSILQSCKEDEPVEITEEDAADIVQSSLESETGGITDDVAMVTDFIVQENYVVQEKSEQLECGVDTSITRTFSKPTGIRTGSCTYIWDILKTCAEADTSISWTGNYNGSYETPRILGTTSGTRDWSIDGIESSNNFLTLNGSVSRNGSHTSKIRQQRSFSSETSYQFTDVVVSKQSQQIQSGTGSFQILVNVSDETSKTFTGTITFNGNGSATLVINGQTFTFDIYY